MSEDLHFILNLRLSLPHIFNPHHSPHLPTYPQLPFTKCQPQPSLGSNSSVKGHLSQNLLRAAAIPYTHSVLFDKVNGGT